MSKTDIQPGFDCTVCGAYHDKFPMAMSFSSPDVVSKMLPWDKEKRVQISEDWCIVDDNLFYLRGCLLIPVHGFDEPFSLGVWSTLTEHDFDMTMELWSNPLRTKEPPYFGMLANEVPFYEDTRLLQTKVQTRAPGDRPLITVPDQHPLGIDQRDGISREHLIEWAKMALHGGASNPYSHLCD